MCTQLSFAVIVSIGWVAGQTVSSPESELQAWFLSLHYTTETGWLNHKCLPTRLWLDYVVIVGFVSLSILPPLISV